MERQMEHFGQMAKCFFLSKLAKPVFHLPFFHRKWNGKCNAFWNICETPAFLAEAEEKANESG
jgi:hypothetical protein